MSDIENPAGALATIRRHAESARALASSDAYYAQEAPRLEAALAAVIELAESAKQVQDGVKGDAPEMWSRFEAAIAGIDYVPAAIDDRDLAYKLGDAARVAFLEHGKDAWVTIGRAIVAALRGAKPGAQRDAMVEDMKRIERRAAKHPDDTDDDRKRNLYHIESIARMAIARSGAAA